MKLVRWVRAACLVAIVSVVIAGCGSSSSTQGGTTPQTSAAVSPTTATPASSGGSTPSTGGPALTIKSFSFSPNPLVAKVGDTVTVTNLDGTNHTVTALDGSFNVGPFSSGSRTFRLAKAGTFNFHCNIHNFMTGVIQVSA